MQGKELQIVSSFPPTFLCEAGWSSCSLSVRWELESTEDDLVCQDDHVVNQIAFGGQPPLADACCDVMFTADNWHKPQTMLITAKRDSLVDGDHMRRVHFKYRVQSDNSTPELTTIQTFNVSTGFKYSVYRPLV